MTPKEKGELIYKEESYAIIGACFAVYKDKGCGFHEPLYHECLEIEFEFQKIPFLSKPPQTLQYRGRTPFKRSPLIFFAMRKSFSKSKLFCLSGRVPGASFELSRRHRLQIGSARKLWPLSEIGIRSPPAEGI
jgi:hypothetical protein